MELATATAKEVLDVYPLVKGEEYVAMMQSEVDQKGNELLRSGIKKHLGYTDLEFGYVQGRPVSQGLIDLFTERKMIFGLICSLLKSYRIARHYGP